MTASSDAENHRNKKPLRLSASAGKPFFSHLMQSKEPKKEISN
jgi:hypothetical protein